MSKIGDILNKDVGSLAAKVLKADVADLVKGAGRALNTDVGSIAKGAGGVLKYDLSDLFKNTDPVDPGSANATSPPAGTASAATQTSVAGQTPPSPHVEIPGSTGAFPPVATTAQSESAEPPKARLTDALVNRQRLKEPVGSGLLTLLPLAVGSYAREAGNARGEIASDPVNVTYSGNGEAVSVTVVSCWDADEARDQLERNRGKLENSRGSTDLKWVAGIDARGVVFLWVRNSFCYEVVSPRGVSPIARFLGDFPY